MEFKKAFLQEISPKPTSTAPVGPEDRGSDQPGDDPVPDGQHGRLREGRRAAEDELPGLDLDTFVRPRIRQRRRGDHRSPGRRADPHSPARTLRAAADEAAEGRTAQGPVHLRLVHRHRRDDHPQPGFRSLQRERGPASRQMRRDDQGAEAGVRREAGRPGSQHRSGRHPARSAHRGPGERRPSAGTTAPSPTTPTDRTGTALAGETAPDFAARMGLDPTAWKGLQGITDPLNLQAGQQIDFSSSLSAGAGIGVEVGATADLGTGPAPPPGAAAASPAGPPASGAMPAQLPVDGTGLTAAGGLARALDRVAAATAASAASSTRQAFATGPSAPGAVAAPAAATSAAVTTSLSAATPAPSAAAAAPSPDAAVSTADPRAVSYGFGVPLRPRLGVTGPITAGLVRELHRNVASGGDQPPQTSDPTVPGWLALSTAELAPGEPCGRLRPRLRLRRPLMSLHIGEVTSQVEVHGTPGAGGSTAASGSPSPPVWELRERHRELAEDERESRRRTAGRGSMADAPAFASSAPVFSVNGSRAAGPGQGRGAARHRGDDRRPAHASPLQFLGSAPRDQPSTDVVEYLDGDPARLRRAAAGVPRAARATRRSSSPAWYPPSRSSFAEGMSRSSWYRPRTT